MAPPKQKNPETAKYGHRLTPEQVASIPMLYAVMGSQQKVADHFGCDASAISKRMNGLSGEEWDHIKEAQRKAVLEKSVEILYQALDLVPGKLANASVRDLMGAVKIMADRIALWGGIGAVDGKPQGADDELTRLLAEGEAKRRQKAIEEAFASGSLEPLRAFVVAENATK